MTIASAASNGDVLSAASLLLAILAVLFSLWYRDITAALEIVVPKHLMDADVLRRQVSNALKQAAPLAVASAVLFLVFVPEAIRLTSHWVGHASDHGLWHAIRSYDTVELSIVAVVLFLALLCLYTISLAIRLLRLRHKLSP